jgi:hypothetical protein
MPNVTKGQEGVAQRMLIQQAHDICAAAGPVLKKAAEITGSPIFLEGAKQVEECMRIGREMGAKASRSVVQTPDFMPPSGRGGR